MKAAVLLAAAMGLTWACGSPAEGVFPDEIECVQPAPVATSQRAPGSVSPQAYTARMRSSSDTIERLRSGLRAKYAEDTFYRREAFRPDFAAYADETICTAQGMLDLTAPDARFEKYEADLDAALTALIDHTRAGREAVRARNVSDYRDWFKGADAKIAAVRTAANAVR